MQDSEFTQVINNILGSDNNLRKQSEAILNEFKIQQTDNFIIAMINLLKSSPQENVRQFSAVALRKNLSQFSEQSYENLYYKLSQQTEAFVKQGLFSCLETEPTNLVRHSICDAIGEIGGSILEKQSADLENGQNTPGWPELIPLIFQCFTSNKNEILDAGLRILSTIFQYASDNFLEYKKELMTIFQQGLLSVDNKIKSSTLNSIGSFVEVKSIRGLIYNTLNFLLIINILQVLQPNQVKQFYVLVPQCIETTLYLLDQDEDLGQEALGCLCDIAEAEPKFYKEHFSLVFQAMHKITFNKKLEESGTKQSATELLISIGERIPSLFRDKHKSNLEGLLEMIFIHMVEIDKEIDQEWMTPKEGFNEDMQEDSDLEVVRFGMNGIDRLISSIGEKFLLPCLSKIVQQMFQQEDWRYKNAAIMALSQVGEYIENIEEVKPIIDVVLNFSNNPNPKIRYAVCHCIGQIADDMQPKFQEVFHEKVMTQISNLLCDQCPRVVAHSAACLTNFVEGMQKEDIQNYLKPLLQKCFEILQNSISIVKENVISAVAACAEAVGDGFIPYYNDAVPFLFNLMIQHQGKEYRQLRGQLIECLTLMAHAVGWDHFQKYADRTIQIMLDIQNSNLEQVDPQKSYLLSGWQRLCLVMQSNFQPYLQNVLPSLFSLLSKIFNETQALKSNEDDEANKQNYNTFDSEEAEIALNMLSVIIDEMGPLFAHYVESASKIIMPLCDYQSNDNIRKSAAACLPGLIKSVKSNCNDPSFPQQLTRLFLQVLWNATNTEYQADIIQDQIYAIKDCIEEYEQRFMSTQEIQDMSSKIVKLLMESDKRKTENDKFKQTQDLETEEVEMLDDDNDTEEDLHVALAELIGALFKTHKELTMPLVDLLYTSILKNCLQPNLSDKMHKFGLFLVDDMIEFLGIELIPDKWPFLSQALLQYVVDKTCYVRQAAAYGIGLLAEKSKEIFAQISQQCVDKLYQALQIPIGTDKAKVYGNCKDNVVAALGKIIKAQSQNIDLKNVMQVWLNELPLKNDKPEALVQHEFLCDIMIANPQVICGQDGNNLPKIIKVYGEILDTKVCNPAIKQKIITSLNTLKQIQQVQTHWEQIVAQLNQVQKKRLEDCIRN